jgi:hypothetical protein
VNAVCLLLTAPLASRRVRHPVGLDIFGNRLILFVIILLFIIAIQKYPVLDIKSDRFFLTNKMSFGILIKHMM